MRGIGGLAGAVVLLCAATGALASPEAEAVKLIDEGVARFHANDLEGARAAFLRARELMPDKANPRRWLGMTYARLGQCREAVDELTLFIARVPESDARWAEAVAIRDRCVDELKPKFGALDVTSEPSGAQVVLDDERSAPVGTTPFHSDAVPIGNHVVYLRLADYAPASRGVTINQGGTVAVALPLTRAVPLPDPVSAEERALKEKVELERVQAARLAEQRKREAEYAATAAQLAREEARRKAEAEHEERRAARARGRVAGYVMIGAGVVFGSIAIALAVVSGQKNDAIKAGGFAKASDIASVADNGQILNRGAIATGVIGGVAGVLAVVLLVTQRDLGPLRVSSLGGQPALTLTFP
jgi:hypothetical protein